MKTTVHEPLEFDVLGSGLGSPNPVPGDTTTNIAFGSEDMRRAVITLSRSGRVVQTRWPRPGLPLHVMRP
jgi:hypothetical protein